MTPLVSVSICSFNHVPYLPAAIESALGQTLDAMELIVVDDGSSDGSLVVAEQYAAADSRVRVVTHPGHANLGLAATGNLARSLARGRYLIGLPSDDVLYPDALEREVDLLERRPELGYVYGYAHLIDDSGERLRFARTFGIDLTPDDRTVELLVQGNTIPAMTVMFRRECIEQAGEEDPNLVYSDWELYARAAAHWQVGFIPRALAMHRLHGGNVSLGAGRTTNLERAVEVTASLRERAPVVGGRLSAPRVRGTLELQMGFLRFASGDPEAAASYLRAAFDRDPSLASDGRWLGDWLWSRLLDDLLASDGPDFVSWVAGNVAPHLDPGASRRFRRESVASEHLGRAVQLARRGRTGAAHRAALSAIARSPRHALDKRLPSVLLDSMAGRSPAKGYRIARSRLLSHR